jgi:hypothetical protein
MAKKKKGGRPAAWVFDPTVPTPQKKRRKIPKDLQGKKQKKSDSTVYTHNEFYQGGSPGGGKRR